MVVVGSCWWLRWKGSESLDLKVRRDGIVVDMVRGYSFVFGLEIEMNFHCCCFELMKNKMVESKFLS